MIARYFYQEDIARFIAEDSEAIFGKIAHADEMDTASTQKFAWEQEIAIMKSVLLPYVYEPGRIIFEYTIPRMGKRIDVVVLLRERICTPFLVIKSHTGSVTLTGRAATNRC